jgi:uncharacterized protein with von Willebrand factor type A (vWA) domain
MMPVDRDGGAVAPSDHAGHAAPTPPPGGHLADHVLAFARLLRRAGLPVGTDRVLTALQALAHAGFARRDELRHLLGACLIGRHEHRALFDEAFDAYWVAPVAGAGGAALPSIAATSAFDEAAGVAVSARLAAALAWSTPAVVQADGPGAGAGSDAEHLWRRDFATMDIDEWRAARRLLSRLPLLTEPRPTRRLQPAPHGARGGRIDGRATLAAAARHGGEAWDLRWRRHRVRPAPLVLLADVSGSMDRYARMLLQLGHTLARAPMPVETFVLGTRLTRLTRWLRDRDPDLAVAQAARAVPDWGGGTRLGQGLHAFHRDWARRVMPAHATVLLITDGLEPGTADAHAALSAEMARLRRSCRRLVWVNPLLRYARFEPRAAGIRAMLPHVDRFVPGHDLASVAALIASLTAPAAPRRPA